MRNACPDVSGSSRQRNNARENLERRGNVVGVRGRGLLIGVETAAPAADIVAAARDEGLLVLTAGENVLRLAPPLTVGVDEVAAALEVLARVVTLPR